MNDRLVSSLKKLTEIPGISGYEQQISTHLAEGLMDLEADITREPMGNLVVTGKGEAPFHIGVYAHMDEIGLIVRRISPHGQIYFDIVGNLDERLLLASEWTVISRSGEEFRAVIGNKSRHLQTGSDTVGTISARDLFLDIGATSADEVKGLGIDVGCQIVFATKAESLEFGVIKAKALDNRASCFVLFESLRDLIGQLDNTKLYGLFTVQEEVGARGARVAGFGKKLNMTITLDTVPVQNPGSVLPGEVSLGKGPIVRLMDYHPSTKLGTFSNPLLTERLIQVAEENGIPYQVDVLTGTYLDSSTALLTEGGLPGISICIPRRYSHTPVELCSYDDIENTLKLLELFIRSLDKDPVVFERKFK